MTVRMQHAYLMGRLALGRNASTNEVGKYARVLEKVDTQVSRVWALLLRAGSALGERDQSRSEKLLTAAGDAARTAGMKLASAVARYRLAELRGDDALLQTASGEMRDLGVRSPTKTAALIIPIGRT
jgi:hypothetical protein